jgi:hypothetical protein
MVSTVGHSASSKIRLWSSFQVHNAARFEQSETGHSLRWIVYLPAELGVGLNGMGTT